MEEKLREFIGKRVHITFESKRYNGIFNLTGILADVDHLWADFINPESDYPDGAYEMISTSRIRSVC